MILAYVTNPSTGKIHLFAEPHRVTLCHRPIAGMELGDETLSGVAVTCGTCARVYADHFAPVR